MSNDFLPFAIGTGANVEAQGPYAASVPVATGFQTGIVPSNRFNKALRQASVVASALAQYMANVLGVSIADDGDWAGFVTHLTNALGMKPGGAAHELLIQTGANVTGFLPAPTAAGQVVTFDGTNVIWGAGGGSTVTPGTDGHAIDGAGNIVQWMEQNFAAGSQIITVTYPFPFPNTANMPRVCAANPAASGTSNQFIGVTPVTWGLTGCTVDIGSVPGGGGGVLSLDIRGT
jgi:hypothetical protein